MKCLSRKLGLAVLVVITNITSAYATAFVRPSFSANKIEQSSVTLITGDTAVFDINQSNNITLAQLTDPTNEFNFYIKNTQAYLIPNHAQALIAQGIVDTELFNLSKLVSLKLDDRNSHYLPVLVKYSVANQRLEVGVDSQFYPAINTQFIRLDKAKLNQTWLSISTDPTIKSVTLDKQITHH